MSKIKNIALTASIIAALGLSTAYAATQDTTTNTNTRGNRFATCQGAPGAAVRRAGMAGQRRPVHQGMKVLAEITGKDEATILKECREQKLNPAQYAQKAGKYNEFKAKRLELAKDRMSQAVADGKLTQDKADQGLKRFAQILDDQRDGKRPLAGKRKLHQRQEAKGPQGECILRRNPDGSLCPGQEGMAYREHPMYGHMPLDTLASLTGKSTEALYAEASKEQLTCAGMAKKLGILDQYKSARLEAHKTLLDKAVAEGRLTVQQVENILANISKNIDAGQHERGFMGNHRPGMRPMPRGPLAPAK